MKPAKNRIRYLRVSLLNGCNLNCFYCRPRNVVTSGSHDRAQLEQFEKTIDLLYQLGIRKVRFTGGEPTLYPQLPKLIESTCKLDETMITALTTNGLMMERLAPALAQAGLHSANISLDTLDREKFRSITTFDRHHEVLKGIEAAIKHIPMVKLNCVVIDGVNHDEPADMVAFANELRIDIRFIEYMPTKLRSDKKRGFIGGEKLRHQLPYDFTPYDTGAASAASYYTAPDLSIRVGFINPVSSPFCAHCDRLRLASDGTLYGCLFSNKGFNMFELLSCDTSAAVNAVKELVDNKEYLGCSGAMKEGYLPAFSNLGG